MVDGIVLLVDASEGPLPQTRFVLRKALNADMPVVLVVNKVDRSDARIDEVVDETYELFLDLLDEHHSQDALDFPVVYASARAGRAARAAGERHASRLARPRAAVPHHPGEHPGPDVRRGRAAAGARDQPRRLPVPRPAGAAAGARRATLSKGQKVAWMKRDGRRQERPDHRAARSPRASSASPRRGAGPGDIVAVAGIPDITIGETLADPENPVALPLIHVDEPAISMTIGTNTSPLVGRVKGPKVTARLVKDRLDAELVGNVSLRMLPDRAPRRLGGAGPRRAGAGDPGRADAPRGLRADRRQAAGGDPRGRRQGARAGASG